MARQLPLTDPARIAFAGTPEFAVPALERLAASGASIELVLTQPDRRSGRGRKLTASPVKHAAERLGLSVAQPATLRTPELAASWPAAPDVLVVAAYGLLLPQWLLDWPRCACVNVHASLLPRWRGAAPIQHAILAGEAETGVSIMRMEAGLDTGPVYAARPVGIDPDMTAGRLHDVLAELGAALLAEVLPGILAGSLVPKPQDDASATWAGKIAKADARLDFNMSAAELERRVRAFNPWPVAEAGLTDGRRLRIWRAAAIDAEAGAPPGTILAAEAQGIDVATGDGLLRIERVQVPSAAAMDAGAWLAAHRLEGASFVC